MNFEYVDGSSYSDQLKISRWSSSGCPPSGFADAPLEVDVPPPEPVVVVPPHAAASSMRPPRPRAWRRLMGRPASASTSRCIASSFGLLPVGASRCRWSRSVMVASVGGVVGLLDEQDRRGVFPLDGDQVSGAERVLRAVGSGPLLADQHPGAAVENGDDLKFVPQIHLGVHDP